MSVGVLMDVGVCGSDWVLGGDVMWAWVGSGHPLLMFVDRCWAWVGNG